MKNYKDEALRNIRERAKNANMVYNQKMKGLCQNEEFKSLMTKYTRIKIENARKLAYDEIPNIQLENELKLKLDKYLKFAQLKDLKPDYTCKMCDDTGFDGVGMCICLKTEIQMLMIKDNGFENLPSFEESIDTSEENRGFYEKMLEWCNTSKRTKILVFICGAVGVGKTHLEKCIGKKLIEQGMEVNVVSSVKFDMDTKGKGDAKQNAIKEYSSTPVLIIDDLGVEDTASKALHIVLSTRAERKLLTIITSNLTPADIAEQYGERIFSRLMDINNSICFQMIGRDRRRNAPPVGNFEQEIYKMINR